MAFTGLLGGRSSSPGTLVPASLASILAAAPVIQQGPRATYPSALPGSYSFLACNALTNTVIGELPVEAGASYSRLLNDSGTLEATVPLDDVTVQKLGIHPSGTEPAAVSVYVQRDGEFVWGGLLWKHEYDSTTGGLKLTAQEFGSYLSFRYFVDSITWTDDISNLAKTLAAAYFGDGGPPLVIAVQLTGKQVTLKVNWWEQHLILDLFKSWQALQGGFDWAFDVTLDGNGNPCAQLTISWPRRGQSYVHSGVSFDYPGPVTKFDVVKDGSLFAEDLIVTGAGSGATMITEEVVTYQPSSGYVKLQQVDNNRDLTTAAHALTYAQGKAKTLGGSPPITMTAQVYGPSFMSAGVTIGDEITLAFAGRDAQGRVQVPYYPNGANVPQRIIGTKVTLPQSNSPEVVDLTLGAVL